MLDDAHRKFLWISDLNHTTLIPYWAVTICHMITPMGPVVWIHTRGTQMLGPTNPRIMSVDLHTTLDEFHYFPKANSIRRINHQALYTTPQPNILTMWDLPHMWSISNAPPHMWVTSYPRTTFGSDTMKRIIMRNIGHLGFEYFVCLSYMNVTSPFIHKLAS